MSKTGCALFVRAFPAPSAVLLFRGMGPAGGIGVIPRDQALTDLTVTLAVNGRRLLLSSGRYGLVPLYKVHLVLV